MNRWHSRQVTTASKKGSGGSVRLPAEPRPPVWADRPPLNSPPPEPVGGLLSRRLLAAAALAAVVIGGILYSMLALSNDKSSAARPGRAPSAASAASPSATAAAGSPTTPVAPSASGVPGLAAPLFTPPAPWVALPDDVGQTGRVSLARAVTIDGHGELSKTGLQQLGFVVGQTRSWQTGQAALLVLDYTFKDIRGAAGFVTYGRRARDGDPAFSREPVRNVPGAVGYAVRRPGSTTSVAIFSRGRSAYLIGIQGTPPPGAAGDVGALALAQYTAAR